MEKTTAEKMTIPVPGRMTKRPRHGGYVVPYFVAWFLEGRQVNDRVEGAKPHFPTTDQRRLVSCRRENRCWICGDFLGAYKAFVFGPASALARLSYEPPSHRECARYAMRVCPYLRDPNYKSVVERGYVLKEGEQLLPDVVPHHPGVTVVYVTRNYGVEVRDPSRGIYVFLPDKPIGVEFWTAGRRATYKEAADATQKAIVSNKMLDGTNNRELAWRVRELLEGAVHEHDLGGP